jgi:hypothetical protein
MKKEDIWKSLEKIGTAAYLLRKLKNSYNRTIKCVKTRKGQSIWFETSQEPRSISSPILFNTIMNDVCNTRKNESN